MKRKQKVSLVWMPFPDYVPDRSDVFIVSINPRGTPLSFYDTDLGYFEGWDIKANTPTKLTEVKAWAEMPEGYRED